MHRVTCLLLCLLAGVSGMSRAETSSDLIPPATQADIFAGLDLPASDAAAPGPASAAAPVANPVATPAPQAMIAPPVPSEPGMSPPLPAAVELYSQEELVALENRNEHLQRVKADDCQLVQDIEARAEVMKLPAYQFLWGDMLAWGVCVDKDAEQGIGFMWDAARQGLPAALEQLGRYYANGTFVQKDRHQAALLMHEAASLGFVKAQIGWVRMLVAGAGSPLDYEEAYRWLHHAVIGDAKQHREAARLLAQLARRMPANVVKRAQVYR